MHILHLAASLRVAINPDHVAAIRAPGLARRHHATSLPTGTVAMASPTCRAGSTAVSVRESVDSGSPSGRTSSLESWTDTSTGCPTLNRADRATAAGIRTARLLPHCCHVSVALLVTVSPPTYKHVYTSLKAACQTSTRSERTAVLTV